MAFKRTYRLTLVFSAEVDEALRPSHEWSQGKDDAEDALRAQTEQSLLALFARYRIF
ncbi:MAG TPA: hypothetical protein VFV38_32335 [Ktedonobacteraceae bacterium]|nr:hypothetical protein [Ktedonobacteraceae bacterium]